MSKSPASSRASARARRSETGDTLIEVLLAIVVLGLASVALMLAFTTDISSSGEHRSLTTVDILLKSFSESAISQIEQNYQSCATASTYSSTGADPVSFTMPSGDSAYTVGIDTAVPVAYWNGSTFSSTGCSTGSTASQEITAMASGPYGVNDTLTFVVNDPLAPAPPVYGTATQLVFLNSPSNSATGAVFGTQPVVAVEDQNGNIVTSDFSDISLTITQTGATVPNCVVVPNYGVDSFTGCSISQAGSYTLTATDSQEENLTTGLALTGTSGTFTVGAAASNYFSVAYPGPQTAGVPFTDTITATDANGNILTTYTGNHTITFSGPANSPNATAPTYFEPVTFVSGVATIGMTLVDAQTTTLTATDSTGITGTSASFAVQTAPADATQSTVSASPTAVTANGVSSSTVAVTLEDAYGNPVSGDTVTLAQSNGAVSTISVPSGPSSSTGTVTFTVTDTSAEAVTYKATDSSANVTVTQAATVTYYAVPTVASISPNAGPLVGGTTVTITGTGFVNNVTTVSFASNPASSVTVVSGSSITAVSPAASAGTVDVTVTTPGGTSATSSADHFTYDVVPTVSSINPAAQTTTAAGTTVTITGTGFLSGATVLFGANPATNVTVVSSTSITAKSPAGTTGTSVAVTVTTPGGTSPAVVGDLYGYGPSVVTSVSPNAGPLAGGTTVTITGTGFVSGSTVKFGANSGTGVTVNSSTSITATSPGGSSGTVNVIVTTPGGISATSAADQFTYDPAPTVTSLTPAGQATGNAGTSVTITGTGFVSGSTVKFGANAATGVTVTSSTSITAISPAGTSGTTVNVEVTTPGGTSATAVGNLYAYGAPTVTSISPAGQSNGNAGTTVTITGTGFVSGSTVSFGTNAATGVTVNSATSITATSPAGTTGTSVNVEVTTPGGTSTPVLADLYGYGAPTVTSITPTGQTTGTAGTTVTITGTGFVSGSTVFFGANAATGVTVTSSTSITATSPAGATGTSVNVEVTTPGGTSAAVVGDLYGYGAPTVTSLSPAAQTNGTAGTTVTITGTGFVSGSTVSFGSNAGTSVTVVSSTSITVKSPAGTSGTTVNVQVTTPGGTSAAVVGDLYAYGAPTITLLNPNSQGNGNAGTIVTITGTGFVNGASVKFGSNPGTSVTVNSSTSLTVVSPAKTGGSNSVAVTVTTPGGTSGSLTYTY